MEKGIFAFTFTIVSTGPSVISSTPYTPQAVVCHNYLSLNIHAKHTSSDFSKDINYGEVQDCNTAVLAASMTSHTSNQTFPVVTGEII